MVENVVVVERPAIEGHDYHESWRQLKSDKKFPKDHVYYHEKVENLRDMKRVHFEDANSFSKYLGRVKHHTANQSANLDINEINGKHMDAFVDIMNNHKTFSDLSLNCYESKHLNHDHFKGLANAIHSQEHLKKVNVNLRWCD